MGKGERVGKKENRNKRGRVNGKDERERKREKRKKRGGWKGKKRNKGGEKLKLEWRNII